MFQWEDFFCGYTGQNCWIAGQCVTFDWHSDDQCRRLYLQEKKKRIHGHPIVQQLSTLLSSNNTIFNKWANQGWNFETWIQTTGHSLFSFGSTQTNCQCPESKQRSSDSTANVKLQSLTQVSSSSFKIWISFENEHNVSWCVHFQFQLTCDPTRVRYAKLSSNFDNRYIHRPSDFVKLGSWNSIGNHCDGKGHLVYLKLHKVVTTVAFVRQKKMEKQSILFSSSFFSDSEELCPSLPQPGCHSSRHSWASCHQGPASDRTLPEHAHISSVFHISVLSVLKPVIFSCLLFEMQMQIAAKWTE